MASLVDTDDRATMMRRERRAQILLAAKQVFGERGFHNASINDIIGRAKIARGTFYLYFPGKETVFASILDQALEDLRSLITRIDVAPDAPPPNEQLRGSLVRVLEYVAGDRNLSRMLLGSGMDSDAEVASRVRDFFQHVEDLIARSLVQGIEMGLVRECNTEIIAAALLGAVRGIIDHLLSRESSPDVEGVVDDLIAFALRGVVISDRW